MYIFGLSLFVQFGLDDRFFTILYLRQHFANSEAASVTVYDERLTGNVDNSQLDLILGFIQFLESFLTLLWPF